MTYQYIRIDFQDLNVTNPYTYKLTQNKNGTVSMTEKFGDVIVEGTPLNAENMNHLEDGIYTAIEGLNVLEARTALIDNKQDKSTAVTYTGSSAVGSASQPVYVTGSGEIALCSIIPSATSTISSGSTSVITSGAVFSALSLKEDKEPSITSLAGTGTSNLESGKIYRCVATGTKEFVLPEITDFTKFSKILVQIHMENVVSINVGTTYFFDKTAPDLSEPGSYDLYYEHDGINWICGFRSKGQVSQ